VEDLLAGKDLASEAQAKDAEAREERRKRSEQKVVESIGVSPAWSSSGRFSGVAVDPATNTVYAATQKAITLLDSAGTVQKEIAAEGGDILRLANLAGDGAPEMILFQGWGPSVKAFDADGQLLWDYSLGEGVDDVWPADLNGDGMDEVIIGYNGNTGLHVLDQRGTLLWKFTEIGNVWHVTAGDFDSDNEVDVVTTSASGDLHVFNSHGEKKKDIDASVYGSMVRMAKLGDAPALAIVCGAGNGGESMIALTADGDEKWSIPLPHVEVDHVDDLAISTTTPWASAAMRGGLVHVVDLDSARIVASATEQGMRPQVAWINRQDQSPLLVVATGDQLNAFEIAPVDTEAPANGLAEQAIESENSTPPASSDDAAAVEPSATPANSGEKE
jgi:hypothetical protein